jgi:hypothetical protein
MENKSLLARIMRQAALGTQSCSKHILSYWTVNRACFRDRVLLYIYRMAKRKDWMRIITRTCSKRCLVEFYDDAEWELPIQFMKLTPLRTQHSHFVLTPTPHVYFSTTLSDAYIHAHQFRTVSYAILHLKANARSDGVLVYCLKVEPATTDYSTINGLFVRELSRTEKRDKKSYMCTLKDLAL